MPPTPYNTILDWFGRSQLDYRALYMNLFVAYNAWFREVTSASNDRRAIELLKRRFPIWYDYQQGRTLMALRPLVEAIASACAARPNFAMNVVDADDYQGLIEYWYQVRCQLFHGANGLDDELVRLAYRSLRVFMGEIIDRMQQCFTADDSARLHEVDILVRHDPELAKNLLSLQRSLQAKYVHSPDLWNVDMVAIA